MINLLYKNNTELLILIYKKEKIKSLNKIVKFMYTWDKMIKLSFDVL